MAARPRSGSTPARVRGQARAQALQLLRAPGGQVHGRERIPLDVVELGPRRLDEQPVSRAQAEQLARAPPEARVVGLEVGRARLAAAAQGDEGDEARAVEPAGDGQARDLQDRGHEVHAAHDGLHHRARGQRSRQGQEERDALGAFVDEVRVRQLLVLAQGLPVVADHRHSVGRPRAASAASNRPTCASMKAISPS